MRRILYFFFSILVILSFMITVVNAAERTADQIVHDREFQNSLLTRIQRQTEIAYAQYNIENYLLNFGDVWTDGKTHYLDFAILVDLKPKSQSQFNNDPSSSFLYSIAIDAYLDGGNLNTISDENLYSRMSTSSQVDLAPFIPDSDGKIITIKAGNITKLNSFGMAPANPKHFIDILNGQFQFNYTGLPTYSNLDAPNFTYGNDYKPLFINGSLVQSDVKTVNDRILVPIRAIVEALHGNIGWDDKTRKVTVDKDGIKIEMTIDSTTVVINGQTKTIDVAPHIYDSYTYLPVRFVSENLGASVSWITDSNIMLIKGVQGNVFVDQYDAALPSRSKEESVKRLKATMNHNFSFFKTDFEKENNHDIDRSVAYDLIQKNIDNTKVVGEVSRYYIIDSVQRFYCDKYSNEIFYASSFGGGATWISLYLYGDNHVFAKGYFAD